MRSGGDVAAMPLPGDRGYGACQVVRVDGDVTLACALAWHSPDLPTLPELAGVGPLIVEHHVHGGHPAVINVGRDDDPFDFVWLGRLPVGPDIPTQSNSYSGWSYLPVQVMAQRRWDALPETVRHGYRAAGSGDMVTVDFGAGQARTKVGTGRLDLTGAGFVSAPESGTVAWSALDRLPRVSSVLWRGPDRGLVAAVAERPLITFLDWRDGPADIDLSRTWITDLRLSGATGQVALAQAACSLHLSEPARGLRVRAADEGRRLRLAMRTRQEGLDAPEGLGGVRDVQVDAGGAFSLSGLSALTGIARLQVTFDGPPGVLVGAEHLSAYRGMHTLALHNAYGLDADTLPDLETLRRLEIHGLRRSVAQGLEARYRGSGVELLITGAKSDTWLASNLTNPFRDWADDSARFGAAACRAYATARKAVDAISPGSPDGLEQAERALRGLVAELNRIDERYEMIDTIRREEAGDAFFELAAIAAVPVELAERWFDDRDF
ncbi:hypothetical protein GCM10028775_24420 [Catellatospora paridis]